MPKKVEEELKRQARKKFGTTTSERARRYIWGTMHKIEEARQGDAERKRSKKK